MTSPRLESITISNFRSISEPITVPLGAQVVLLHGPNGAGKTSVLSAIELALTGDIPSMRRSDPEYRKNLLYRGAENGQIVLDIPGLGDDLGVEKTTIDIHSSGVEDNPLLKPETARFYSERCYLAQATLGRLLEIYSRVDTRGGDSPLTKFIKDLLGLDHLDALVEGLHAAGDRRRIQRLVPEYRETKESMASIQGELILSTAKVLELRSRAEDVRDELDETLSDLPDLEGVKAPSSADLDELDMFLRTGSEEEDLVSVISTRREAAALRQQLEPLLTDPISQDRAIAEQNASEARALLNHWNDTVGRELNSAVEDLRADLPDISPLASTDPEAVHAEATERVEAELERVNQLLLQDQAATNQDAEIDQIIQRGRARVLKLEGQIAEVVGDPKGLRAVLAELLSHIDGEDCPVCGRDYSEVSDEPLLSRVSHRVALLAEQAGRIEALSSERAASREAVARAEQSQKSNANRILGHESRVELRAKQARFRHARQKLEGLAEASRRGAEVLRSEAAMRRALAEFRSRDQLATDLRVAVSELLKSLNLPTLVDTDPIGAGIERLEQYANKRQIDLTEVQDRRKMALEKCSELREIENEIDSIEEKNKKSEQILSALQNAFDQSDSEIVVAKELAAAAKEARTSIVRRVFNTSLNTIWRDLFVRLAPNEPFVPAFKLPSSSDSPVVAALETIHRSGGRGGAPASMLSSGNLNTAALTLFLALHLSVRSRLPWLILDDPVQSMDEVHIAQFAALLRTLSKSHGRQIIIAVHDRPFFEYLTLELSPSFEEERLIAVELARSPSGAAFADPDYQNWEPDKFDTTTIAA